MRTQMLAFVFALSFSVAANAATISGAVSDATGAALPQARVVLRDIATGQEVVG